MNNPIVITDDAKSYIETFIQPLGEQAGFRLAVKKSGCSGFSYVADVKKQPEEQDICVTENGLRIFIDAQSLEMVRDTIVDLVTKEFGQKQLVFNNPNAESHCGCGESFTLKNNRDD